MIQCEHCQSTNVIKNGKDRNGNQRYLCKRCGKTFVGAPAQPVHTVQGYAQPVKEPWYQNTGVIALITFCFFPVGLAMIWANPKYKKNTKIGWTVAFVDLIFLMFLGWFCVALTFAAVLWIWVYRKHPASSAAEAPSGRICAYCGAQLPNSGICPYCGGRSMDDA